MKKLIYILTFLLSGVAFGQHPPKHLCLTFTDIEGNIILPELTVLENYISYNDNTDSLYVQSNSLKIDFDDSRFWHYIDTEKNMRISSVNSNFHLGQEIRIIAEFENKTMQITFFGQNMDNVNCSFWGNKITFKEGNFIYDITFIAETKKPLEIFKTNRVQEIKYSEKYLVSNGSGQIVSLTELLKSERYKDYDKYIGFVFDKKTPIGYGVVEKDKIRIIKINKKAVKLLKQYYN